nr:hypothetical protein [Tanacetum cinerariifolium]
MRRWDGWGDDGAASGVAIRGDEMVEEEGQFVSSYILKMKSYIDNLERLGHPVLLNVVVRLILVSLRKEYDSFVQNYNMYGIGNTVNELHAMLKLHEQTLPKKDAHALHAIRVGKVYDTGCGTHIYNTTQRLRGSRKLKPGALSLYMGNVSRNNVVYFSAIPRDVFYEIDLSNSNTNYSFMYDISNIKAKLNLDFTLLWYCHFGHISKKRIEKLQHDRLFNSTDIKSFEKCVSCMSGKIAQKPYSHQVERAKDLLGLIHTDVCAPFRVVSRKGASYFITFIDDFSHYGYVYLLKHKHKVFETFKVFQKEVDNQLRKTIKLLRSDHEGEYMSQDFWIISRSLGLLPIALLLTRDNIMDDLKTQEASESLEDLEIIQEEDTHPSENTSIHHDEGDHEINEPQSDVIPIRRSTRTRHAPDRMCLYIDNGEYELGDLNKPGNYKAALLDPE